MAKSRVNKDRQEKLKQFKNNENELFKQNMFTKIELKFIL